MGGMAKTIRTGSGRYHGLTNQALQLAVDDVAAAGGGVVEIPAGIYEMRDALHLRSGVRVAGEPGTVLLKRPSISVPLLDYLGYGHYELTVTEPDRLEVGTGAYISDDEAFGFYRTAASITGRRGDLFFIDRMLNHDYRPSRNGCVSTLFPIVSGVGVSDVSVENVTVDGNVEETRRIDGCRGGGVYLILSQRARVERVEVRHYNGDAVSFQQCADIVVRYCLLHDNAGGGIHPGSGSVRYIIRGNSARDNGGCGVFYCLRTSHSTCEGNRLERNGQAGISVGERDTDHFIRGNVVSSNRGPGIDFRRPAAHGGDRVRVEDNSLSSNDLGVAQPEARAEIRIPAGLEDVYIAANAFDPGEGKALHVEPDVRRISFSDNTVAGRPQDAGDVAGDALAVALARPATFPAVGPESLPLDGARHLGIGALPVWRE
jgi:hypothetical protein